MEKCSVCGNRVPENTVLVFVMDGGDCYVFCKECQDKPVVVIRNTGFEMTPKQYVDVLHTVA